MTTRDVKSGSCGDVCAWRTRRNGVRTLPMKSHRLKMPMRITGIQDSRRHDGTSDSMPGNRHNVTKYARPMEIMYGHTVFATSQRFDTPPEKNRKNQSGAGFAWIQLKITRKVGLRLGLCTSPVYNMEVTCTYVIFDGTLRHFVTYI